MIRQYKPQRRRGGYNPLGVGVGGNFHVGEGRRVEHDIRLQCAGTRFEFHDSHSVDLGRYLVGTWGSRDQR